jgi:hypothetical protein
VISFSSTQVLYDNKLTMVKKLTSEKITFMIPLLLQFSSPTDIQELVTACGVLSCMEQDQLNSLNLTDKALLLSLCIDTP